jgi:trimethylamine--corrinoid protein Co-methyltransferase
MQAAFEKLFTHLFIALSGAHYIHYAFGLLDRTNSFCPLQAVLDNEQIGKIKDCLKEARVSSDDIADAIAMVNTVMESRYRLYARFARKALQRGDVSSPYRFESKGFEDNVIEKAYDYLSAIESSPAEHLEPTIQERIYREVPGLLPSLKEI